MKKSARELLIGTVSATVGGLIVVAVAGAAANRRAIRRWKTVQKTEAPESVSRAGAFLASLSPEQKDKLLGVFGFWQKMRLLALDEKNPAELRSFFLSLDASQVAKIRALLDDKQNRMLTEALEAGR